MRKRVLYWNVYVGHNPEHALEELGKMIHTYRPHIVGTGESMRIYKHLDKFPAFKDYVLEESYPGRSDTAVLVRKDSLPLRWRWMRMTKWWIGPKHGKKQGPKRYWVGRFKEGKDVLRLSIGHWPFNLAVPETEDRVEKWFKASKDASVHLGDLNMHEAETERYVKRFGGQQVGHKPDRAMFKNCKVVCHKLGEHGSDHQAMLFEVTT